MSQTRPEQSSNPRTVRLRPGSRDEPPLEPDTTDYELSASVAAPHAMRLISNRRTDERQPTLSADARALFQHRLRLCCLIAAVPFGFFLVCAATNFIPLFGRDTVGWGGLALSAFTLCGLVATASYLARKDEVPEHTLRVLEVAVFGVMGLFFAYWQFLVLSATPHQPVGENQSDVEYLGVLAAALIVHFNWFALLVFHGVLVPNSLSRGVGVVIVMCLTSVAICIVAATTHPPTGRNAGVLFAVSTTILAAGAGLSVFGTAKTEALQREVESAREAVREMGQYRLRKKLGHGGMGEVYLAEHRLLKRPCALKRIHPRFLNNPEQLKRFEREVQATAQLRHPNTVEIYDYGRADDGTFYYVMEYLPGLSLEDMVGRHGPLPTDRVVHILKQVCGALKEAHRHGLVHRDIKPSNILVFPDGSPHDQAKVLDFGLVHWLTEEVEPNSKITREGLIVGTPEYMSPEQASGITLDGRSDLFSLGSVAYFLLTGREAFHRGNPMKTLLAVVNEEPAPVTTLNPHVPEDVLAILKKCLAKAPTERYERAADLEAALTGCSCASGWTEERSADWWAAHPEAQPGTGTDLDSLPVRADEK